MKSRLIYLCVLIALPIVTTMAMSNHRMIPESTAQYVDDKLIRLKVESKLFTDPDIKSTHISVSSSKGEVILSGTVDTNDQKALAEKLAKEVEGVTQVKNAITLSSDRNKAPTKESKKTKKYPNSPRHHYSHK